MVSLTSLKYFSVAAEELNFTRAAKRLFISQQALSTHISKLEEYYGIKLFDRGAPLTLTEAGRALQAHTKSIFRSVDDYAREVQDIKNFRQGELTIGIPVTRGTIMLPPLLSAFHQMFPQVTLHLVEKSGTAGLVRELYDGTVDLFIGYQPEDTGDLAVVPLFEEQFVVLVPNRMLKEYFGGSGRPEAGKGPVLLEYFSRLPFVSQNPGTMGGEVFQSICRGAGIQPQVVVSTQNLITEVSLCMEGLGACVVPLTFLSPDRRLSDYGSTPLFSEEGLNRLTVFPLDSGQVGTFQISVCRLRNKMLTQAGREFIRLAREIYGDVPKNDRSPQSHSGPRR